MKQRDAGIDLVRVVAVLAIVAGHVWSGGLVERGLFTWHVPVFFFLSGYLWSARRSLGAELRNRSRTLLKPYVFWFVVIFAAFVALAAASHEASAGKVLAPLYGGYFATRPFTTFWFVFVLFAAAVAWRLLERVPAWARVAYAAVAVVSAPFVGEALAKTPLAIGTALLAVAFIAAGQLVRQFEHRVSRPTWVALGVLVVSALMVALDVSAPLDIKQGDWGTPVLSFAVACAISWALVTLGRAAGARLGLRATRYVVTAALTGFTVVLVHPAILWVLAPLPVPSVAVFVVAVVVPAMVGLVALRTPISQWVTGAPRLGDAVAARRPTRVPVKEQADRR